jgi:cytochrome c oxidase assembly factor CtaG
MKREKQHLCVPEFNPSGLLALIGILSAVLAVATLKRRRRRGNNLFPSLHLFFYLLSSIRNM